MGLRRGVLSALALTFVFAACEHEDIGYLPRSEMSIGKDIVTSPADASDNAASDAESGLADSEGPLDGATTTDPPPSGEPVITGQACYDDEKKEAIEEACPDPGTCIDATFLGNFGLTDIEIPGGFCSQLFFDPTECDNDPCGPQATCLTGEAFDTPDIALCLASCNNLMDCRWEESWSCVAPLDDAPATKVCLPDNLIVQLECEQDPDCTEATE
jgi:hypothetical protein